VCNLAEAMSLKNAVAGLPFGGGKAVLIGDPSAIKTPELIEDYAAVLNTLEGRYITAADVGSTQSDMDALRRYTKFVAGTSVSRGGSGDPSPMTARRQAHRREWTWQGGIRAREASPRKRLQYQRG
jgi:glutamate dehydrogenase/leucine dehydrogenase